MGKHSISFIVLVLIFGLFIGTVGGSLIEGIFGLEFLNRPLFGGSLKVAEDFYVIKNLELRLTPAGLMGFVIVAWLLYRRKESI